MTMRLSPSMANTILSRSPLHAWSESRQGGNEQEEPSPAMLRGLIVDAYFFNQTDRIRVVAAKSWQTNEAKAQKAQAILDGKIPVLEALNAELAESVRQNKARLKDEYNLVIEGGLSQLELEWEMNGVPCKGKLDYFDEAAGIIYELKSTENAEPGHRGRNAPDSGHDIQCASYIEGVESQPKYAHLVGRLKYRWIFCEPSAPFVVVVAEPSGEMLELGKSRWTRAQIAFRDAVKTGIWPGYTPKGEIVRLDPPTWAMSKEFEETMSSNRDIFEAVKFEGNTR